jgi:hypothetical protein
MQDDNGGTDLRFLGMAAAMAARHQARRSNGVSTGSSGLAQSDLHAVHMFMEGAMVGMMAPLDDVPSLLIAIDCEDRDAMTRLRETVRALAEVEESGEDGLE